MLFLIFFSNQKKWMKLLLKISVHQCCSGDHKLVYNDSSFVSFFTVSYKDMKKIITCFLNERTELCNFCKKCIDCKNFLFLYSQFNDSYLKILDRNRNYAVISFMFYFNELKYLRKKNLRVRSYANIDWKDKLVFGYI